MVAAFVLGILGIVFITVGCLIWLKEKISLLHSYHRDKVSEKDKKAFCTVSGLGVISIGIGIILTGVIIGITDSVLSFIAFGAGFTLGIILLIYAERKYNSQKR